LVVVPGFVPAGVVEFDGGRADDDDEEEYWEIIMEGVGWWVSKYFQMLELKTMAVQEDDREGEAHRSPIHPSYFISHLPI
jgi:hypothetical protein